MEAVAADGTDDAFDDFGVPETNRVRVSYRMMR
jgi:hypothetical protein